MQMAQKWLITTTPKLSHDILTQSLDLLVQRIFRIMSLYQEYTTVGGEIFLDYLFSTMMPRYKLGQTTST
jgi:hypothetical protein